MSRLFELMHKPELAASSCDNILGAPVERAEIPPDAKLIFHTDSRSSGADRYRFLRMRLREIASSTKLKTLLVTSPLPQEGKSTVCLNLATALAEGGKKNVLLMEADLHQPALSGRLRIPAWPGLASCLEGRLDPQAAIRRIDPLNWYLLPSGEARANASELLQTAALPDLMGKLSTHFDWIIVDSPPVLPLSDATSLTRHTDATLLVARADSTAREAIEETISTIGRQCVVGILLNGVSSLDRTYSKYGKSYRNYYSDPPAPPEDSES